MSQLALLHGEAPPASWSNPDAVYTPAELSDFLCSLVPWDGIRTVAELSAGRGTWVESVVRHILGSRVSITGVDIDPSCGAADLFGMQSRINRIAEGRDDHPLDRVRYQFVRGDALTLRLGHVDRSVGNPPWKDPKGTPLEQRKIYRHVTRALELSREVLYLLPNSVLEGEMAAWIREETPLRKVWTLKERPFGDKVRGCCGVWWDRAYSGPVEFVPGVSWRGA